VRALKDGILHAMQARYSRLSIEGDNLIGIQALKEECQAPWQIAHIIGDVKAFLHRGIQYSIHHIFCEANMAADWLSKFGHSLADSIFTDDCFSPTLRQIAADDCVGRALVRRDA